MILEILDAMAHLIHDAPVVLYYPDNLYEAQQGGHHFQLVHQIQRDHTIGVF